MPEVSVSPSLAMFPGKSVEEALGLAKGVFPLDQVQICPQTRGKLDKDRAEELLVTYPETKFRLHANTKVEGWSSLADLSNINYHRSYYQNLSEVSRTLNAEAYTVHAGLRRNASVADLVNNLQELTDLFECVVGLEAMYPTDDGRYLFSTWSEYKRLLDLGIPYALDLSHLNIVAAKEGVEKELVKDLLESTNCIEIHISSNDGHRDSHSLIVDREWWQELLETAQTSAIVFSEEKMI